ncbi:MAG: PD-(D/E)XK nuclease family transposase [Erysipelotrichaceae bacterium]|nr:PD-(D/E)XK nuclease family transposase [Erysipelotrichaceae bacterium]
MDDPLMNQVFNNELEATRELLLPILNIDGLEIVRCVSQALVENSQGRNARFDVLANDKEGRLYDIEMQQDNRYAMPKRARYYSSMLDHKSLREKDITDKKMPWLSLPETYVIFFTVKDYFRGGMPVYRVDRYVEEGDLSIFGDDQHIVYVNCSYDDVSSDIGRMIHDLNQSDPACMFNKVLADKVKYMKESEEGGKLMSNVMQKYFGDLIEEAAAESRTEGARSERIKLIGALYDNYRNSHPSVGHDEAVSFISEISGIDRAEVESLISERVS